MDRSLGSLLSPRSRFTEPSFTPLIDLWYDEGHLKARADLPGIKPKDITVTVTDNILTIRGKREADHRERGESYEYSERWFGEFERSIELPVSVESGEIEATFSDGVLDVTLPVHEEIKPKPIEVKVK
jgi:HSP20 family protein